MAFTGSQVSVGTTATVIVAADADGASVCVDNNGTATVFLGGSGVTTSGYRLFAGASRGIDLDAGETLYGIVSTGTVTVDVLKNRA